MCCYAHQRVSAIGVSSGPLSTRIAFGAVQSDRIVQHVDHAHARRQHADADGQPFAIALVEEVQRPEASAVVERARHDVEGPRLIQGRPAPPAAAVCGPAATDRYATAG